MRRSIVRPLIALCIVLGVMALGAIIFIWSGVYGIGADDPHTKPVNAMMTILRNRAVQVGARDVKLRELRDEKMIASGAKNYSEMCVGCHLAPGVTNSELRAGLYPQPPNLSEPSARDPRVAFWVIKHGIKMSAMPAWGASHDDDAIWAMVAFISSMPTMPVAQYQRLAGSESSMPGMSHGQQSSGSMQGMAHGAMKGMEASAAKGEPISGHPHGSMQGPDHDQMKGMQAGKAKGKPMSGAPPQGSSMQGMDHGQMKGMPADTAKGKPTPGEPQQGSMQGMDHSQMKGMQADAGKGKPTSGDPQQGSMQGMDHSQMKGMQADTAKGKPMSGDPQQKPMRGMDMGRMQGGKAPRDARDPDAYANGLTHGSMRGMDMADNASFVFFRFDKLELGKTKAEKVLRSDFHAWFGGDQDKLWIKTDGDRTGGRSGATRTEALWNRAIASSWASQVGIRRDFGKGPGRNWAAVGVQGVAPYWFDVEATAYLGEAGRTAARAEFQYEILFTQKVMLQPNLELNWYGKDDPARGVGRGLSDLEAGLRLRYEIRRQFAPYIGVQMKRKFGKTADFARAAEESIRDTQVVAGVRLWF